MSQDPTFSDVIDYVIKNRNGSNAFRNWSSHDIYHSIGVAAADNLCFVSVDDDNRIDGIVIAKEVEEGKTLEITNILCTSRQAIRNLINKYHTYWSGYAIIAERRAGKMKYYKDTKKLLTKLSNYA